MKNELYVTGVDYDTDLVRSIIVNAVNEEKDAVSTFYYSHWKETVQFQ